MTNFTNEWHGYCLRFSAGLLERARGETVLLKNPKKLTFSIAFVLLSFPSNGANVKATDSEHSRAENARRESAVLWREPTDIRTRNLFYGSGGEKDQPRGPFTFIEEDLSGTNPKYTVRDRYKVKWTVKLGMEAKPETVSSRLVWAAGYFTNEEYFLQDLRVEHMPAHLKRGRNLVGPDGSMHNARLKRHVEDLKKIEAWKWKHDSLTGSRELNGLRVMMALINNWDLKDENNAIYGGKKSPEQYYMVSDLGASFGATGLSFPFRRSKGCLESYTHSKFISKVRSSDVDFRVPSRPALIYVFDVPIFIKRVRMDSLGKHIPRADARWIGRILSALSTGQIHDAFRAGGYSPDQAEAFTKVVQQRIAELNSL
jgi:hypothetical protein